MYRLIFLLLPRCTGIVLAIALPWLTGTSLAQAPVTLDTIALELRQHQPQAALRDAKIALKVTPRDPRLWTMEALAARELNDLHAALAAFQYALHLAPDYLPALEGAAQLTYGTEPAQAQLYLARILRQLPDDPVANSMAGMLDYRRGDWETAVAHFSRSGLGPGTQSGAQQDAQQGTLEAYAGALARLGKDAEAEPLFRKLVESRPDDRQARYNLAVLQLRANRPASAVKTLQPLVDLSDPHSTHDPQALSLAASASESDGDTPRAVTLLREAIGQNPKDPQNYLDFAAISFDHASYAAGITMLDAGLTQLPRSAPLWAARGVLSMQISQIDQAEADFAAANRLDPSQSFGLEAQGLTEIQRHNLPAALAKVRASLQADPNNAYLNYLAAEILKEQGAAPGSPQAQTAIGYAQRAVQLDPKLLLARNLLGSLYQQGGNLPLAEEQCRDVLRQDPSDQEAVFRLILVLRRSGDRQTEIPSLVANLGKLRAEEHKNQVKVDRYHLEIPAPADPH